MHPVFTPSTPESVASAKPLMPMRTALVLDRRNEETLVQYALGRLERGMREYTDVIGDDSWMGIRRKATAQWIGDYSYRLGIPDSIYRLSNKGLGTIRRVIRTAVAKTVADLCGSDPFFALMPAGPDDDPQLCKNAETYAHHAAKKSRLKSAIRMGVQGALIRGESAMKRRFKRDMCPWYSLDSVAHALGKPISDGAGGFVTRATPLAPHPTVPGVFTMAGNPSVVIPAGVQWLACRLPQRDTKEGVEVSPIWYEDFVCDTTAEDIHTHDFVAHCQDVPLWQIQELLAGAVDAEQADSVIDSIKALQTVLVARANQAQAAKGEDVPPWDRIPHGRVAECYVRCDADADGMAEKIFLVVERETRRPLFYDYMQRVMPDKEMPINIIRADPVEHRWYGTGLFEGHRSLNEFLELLFNRINLRCSTSGMIKFSNPLACKETAAGEKINFGDPTKTYTLESGYTKDDAMSIVTLPELDEKANALFQLCLQTIQLETGQISAGEGDVSGMPSTELATGIVSLEKQATALLRQLLMDLSGNDTEGVQAVVGGFVRYAIAYMDDQVVVKVLAGEDWKTVTLLRSDVEDLEFHLSILLTKSRGEDLLEVSDKVINYATQYNTLVATNPSMARAMRPIFVQVLKALEVQDIDSILPPVVVTGPPPNDPNAPAPNDPSAAAGPGLQQAVAPGAPANGGGAAGQPSVPDMAGAAPAPGGGGG